MILTFNVDRLTIKKEDLDFFQFLNNKEIQISISIDKEISKNVFKNKKLDLKNAEITQLSNIKPLLLKSKNNKFKVTEVIFKFEEVK